MALIKVLENDDWIVEYDTENRKYRVSYFEDYHWKDECWFERCVLDGKEISYHNMTVKDMEEYKKNAVDILKKNSQYATAKAVEVAFDNLIWMADVADRLNSIPN